MNIIKKSILWSVAAAASLSITSCDSFLKEYSQDLAKVTSWEDLDEVLLGEGYVPSGRIYIQNSKMQTDRSQDWDILHLMTDELRQTGLYASTGDILGYESSLFGIITWQQETGINAKFKYIGSDGGFFNDLYTRINISNMVLSLIDDQPAPHITDELAKQRVKGEAYYLRGLYYFMLANLYSQPYNPSTAATTPGMPLKFTEYIEDTEFSRATLEDTYKAIISDLENAAELLKDKERKSIYHANRIAALQLLSRVYLYMQDWNKAAEYASMVIEAQPALLDLRTIEEGSNSVSATSPETIFSMGDYFVAALMSDTRSYMYGNQDPAWIVTEEFTELYDRDDLRRNLYIGKSQYCKHDGAFYKFNGQRSAWGNMHDVGSVFLMRTPEAYLTLAEASAYLGDNAKAQSTLEKFLKYRMSGAVSVTKTGNELIEFIRDERAREFLLEGHRWFDLRRYTVNQVYPWSKEIVHNFPYYGESYNLSYFDSYRLEKNDPAYTLPLPRSVRNFQISLGSGERPARVKIAVLDPDEVNK